MVSLGVMQGRLLPKYKGQYQAFPVDQWPEEFQIAADLGLSCIEFILDAGGFPKNPLMTSEGVRRIRSIVEESGVEVKSICADYFMSHPLHGVTESQKNESAEILKTLICHAGALGVKDIVIPCVDQSSLKSDPGLMREFSEALKDVIPPAGEKGVRLCIEADLPPAVFRELIETIGSSVVRINYDSGNSASLGYSLKEEFETYGQWISSVHIKDRVRGGGPVVLGEGDVDFELFFNELRRIGFSGPLIMQAFRDDEGLEIFKQQLAWVKAYVEQGASIP